MSEIMKFPFYIKVTALIIGLIGLFAILFFGQDIIFPILLSCLCAIILYPIVVFLNKKLRFPHIIAVILAIVLFVLIFLGIFYFISIQVSDMANDWTKIKSNFYYHLEHFQQLIRDNFHLSKREQNQIINNATKKGMDSSTQIVSTTLNSFTDIALNLALIPIYTFLFLLYQNLFINFLSKVFKPENHKKLREILMQIKIAIQSYIVGLIFEMIGVSVLTVIGLWIIGVEYFILLGILTGLLNMVPYIGILFAGALTILVSLSSSTDLTIVFGVIIVNIIVQLIDNNILVPLFINSKVQINAFVSIVGIIIGSALGGITGMFLAIPIIAVIKVIFDRIDFLEPWGYLFGDDLPKTYEWHKIRIPHYNYSSSTSPISFENEDVHDVPLEKSIDSTTNTNTTSN
ncbi:AI-2E family transporter [Flavobacterium sp.]|uniref:AI-2E family transporter n=1 Tax=Flavobacterium sp. TaxID=239 RepID=UPI0025FD16E1|nr:AI-2E family transporter [Flavobacterium sp.]